MKMLVAGMLAATLLGGCQSIFGHHAKLDIRPVGGVDSPGASAIALEEGKQFLRSGAVGSAIVALQKAAADPVAAPEAHNGLGVAYAMLGRGDLAERYFQQAIAESPAEAKYSANLARFYQSQEAALVRRQAIPAPAVATEPDTEFAVVNELFDRVIQAGPGAVRLAAATRASAMTRVSQNEVTIRTLPAAPLAAPAYERRRNTLFTASSTAPRNAPYPVRIKFGRAGID